MIDKLLSLQRLTASTGAVDGATLAPAHPRCERR
jgi:hypothetical protein